MDEHRVWYTALVACAIAAGINAGCAPLSDPDLPMHLAMGEWILTHRTVPFVEPFAWTRSGAPFYAYSWLMEIAFYATLRAAGPIGLHLLAAAMAVGATLAGALAARAFGLRPQAMAVLGACCAFIAITTTPFLRPQQFMHVLVPLCWACAAWVINDTRIRLAPLLGMLIVSMLAANSHISFPVTAAPLALFLTAAPTPNKKIWLAGSAIILGWLISPYALVWPEVFRLNFAHNLMYLDPNRGEFKPGFVVGPWVGAALASLPLLAMRVPLLKREWLVFGAMWLVGLIAYAGGFKALGPWWWNCLPLTCVALRRLPTPSTPRLHAAYAGALVMLTAAPIVENARIIGILGAYEGGVSDRRLPSIKAFVTEPLAQWLDRNARAGATGHLLTTFDYGSYLMWRLPSLSESIDSRTIFPDSVVLSERLSDTSEVVRLGPWRSADVAIVPVTYPLATVLDNDAGWRRVGVATPLPWDSARPRPALWVRRSWWATAAKQH